MSALDRLAHARYQHETAKRHPELEWDDGPRKAVAPENYRVCTALRGYFAITDFEVTGETFAKEERRTDKMAALEDTSMPPSGVACSMRLGAVATLL